MESFHQCVLVFQDLKKMVLSVLFLRDGEFDLTYLLTNVTLLIVVEPVVDSHGSNIDYILKVKSQFRNNCFANEIKVVVPVPPFATTPKFRTSIGTVTYILKMIQWSEK